MYLKDFKKIDELIGRMKELIDEIPKDMKSKTFFQTNRSLHELLIHFLMQTEDTLMGKDNENDQS